MFHFGCIRVWLADFSYTWPNARQWTNRLLAHLTEHLVWGQHGPRFVAGEYNGDANTLPELLLLGNLLGGVTFKISLLTDLAMRLRPHTMALPGSTLSM